MTRDSFAGLIQALPITLVSCIEPAPHPNPVHAVEVSGCEALWSPQPGVFSLFLSSLKSAFSKSSRSLVEAPLGCLPPCLGEVLQGI